MVRTKLSRYNAACDEPLLIQSGKQFFENCKGNRRKDYFNNDKPIVLELACGRGEYTVGLSQLYPDRNFIGVDIKGERMMMGIKKWRQEVEETTMPNIAFLRTIIHHLDQFFAPGEIDEIWIVHPDPRPKGHDERRRITSPRFLIMYQQLLKLGGIIRLKTDDDGLFEYSLEQLKQHNFSLLDATRDLKFSPLLDDHHGIETHYGTMFQGLGRTIKYAVRQVVHQ